MFRLPGFDAKFAPESVNVLLLVVHPRELHHMIADCGVCTICSYHEIKSDLDFKGPVIGDVLLIPYFEPCLSCLKVSTGELMIEEQSDIRK